MLENFNFHFSVSEIGCNQNTLKWYQIAAKFKIKKYLAKYLIMTITSDHHTNVIMGTQSSNK